MVQRAFSLIDPFTSGKNSTFAAHVSKNRSNVMPYKIV